MQDEFRNITSRLIASEPVMHGDGTVSVKILSTLTPSRLRVVKLQQREKEDDFIRGLYLTENEISELRTSAPQP